ncbi:MAG: phosphoribosylamine--glycine ligase [Opitutaceae bacterium]|nr:phosphoribosylamine--glycine ligase [Opitutaceae bacterium]
MTKDNELNVLVVGSGGREHALVKSCLSSSIVKKVIAAPGNGGIAQDCPCFPITAEEIPSLVSLAQSEQIDFVIVGPEVPLSLGLVDELEKHNITAYGPKADGARLEASKTFTKEFLLKNKIPSGAAAAFDQVEPALNYLQTASLPIVIKADGLAAGKGVIIATSLSEAEEAVRSMIETRAFGDSGSQILIEECLFGEEISIHLVVSGRDFVTLPTSQDHKRIGENDTGPNTGGMGAYSPAELVGDNLLRVITETISKPSVEGIADEGIDFRGTLFIGIMVTPTGPKVLEFNTRFGDPETQVILPRLVTDPIKLMHCAATRTLSSITLEIKPEYALCVVLASQGYPNSYPKGETVTIEQNSNSNQFIFHAGTKQAEDGSIQTNRGRVFGVTALASSLEEAARDAYALTEKVSFTSKYLRSDIGAKQLKRTN